MSRKKTSTLDREWEQENGRKITNSYGQAGGTKNISQLDSEWEKENNKLLLTAGEAYDRQQKRLTDANRRSFLKYVNGGVMNYVNARMDGKIATLQTAPYADRNKQYGDYRNSNISPYLKNSLLQIADTANTSDIERRANETKSFIQNGTYEDIYNTVENRLKERSLGEKIVDFTQGNGYIDSVSGERISTGKESRIMTILQDEYGMSEREAQNIAMSWGDLEASENENEANEWYEERQDIYNQMPDEAKEIVANIYKRGLSNPNVIPAKIRLEELGYDPEEMYEFYRRKVEREKNEAMLQSVEDAGVAKNMGQNTLAVGATLLQPLDLLDQAYYTITGTPYDTSLANYTNYKNAVRNETSNRIVESTGSELAGKGYGLTTSMADSAAAMATGPAALPIMAMDAGANAYVDAIDRGLGEEKAAWTALANGGFEALFEKISLDHLWKMAKPTARAGLKKSVVNVLAHMGIEGSEEVATSIADTIADRVINGNQSEYDVLVRGYMEQGLDEKTARMNASRDFAESLVEDFIGGAVSGGVFGTAAEAIGTHKYRKIAESLSEESTEALYDAAMNAPEGTTANEIANSKEIAELTENDKVNVMKSLAELSESEPTIRNVLENELVKEGVSRKDAKEQAAQLIDMLVQGENVSEEEQARNEENLTNNEAQARVYGKYLTGQYKDQYEGKTGATDVLRRAQEDYYAPKMERESQRTARKVSKDTGISVVRATLKDFNIPTSIVGFSDATNDASLLRSYDSKTGAKPVSIQDVVLPEDVKAIYYNASSLKDTYAANAAVESYKGESPSLYNLGVTTAYFTGRNGIISFDEMKNNAKNSAIFSGVSEATLMKMYFLGQNAAKREEKNPKGIVAAGKEAADRKGKIKGSFHGLDQAVELHAKKTGLDIEAKKSTEHNANGYFAPSMMKIVLREDANLYQTLMHETNEFADTFNPKGMKEVYDSVIAFMGTERGAAYLAQMGRDYLARYKTVNENETYREALEELSNDVIGAMFSTDEGIHEYMDWLNNDSGMNLEERKSIVQRMLDFFESLYNSIKEYVDNNNLARNTERILEAGEDKLSHIRQQVLKEWDAAIENSKGKGKVAPVKQEEKKFSLGKAGREFENEELYNFIEETEAGNVRNWEHFTINETVSERLIKDVKELLGIDITGYTNEIVPDDIRHIFRRHGKNGIADHSMKDNHDIAKAPYVIENYDHIKVGGYSKGRRNSDGTKARTIVLSKKIDDLFYYVAEVVPDSKAKKIFLQSTYANKNDTYSQVRNVKNPTHNVQNEAESDVSFNNSISRNEENAIRYSLSIDEAWEEVMNGMDDEFVDSSFDFAKGVKYNDLPSILEEGFHSLKNVSVNRKDIDSMAKQLIRKYKSTYSADEFADNMERVFAYMKDNENLQFADLYRVMKEVTEPMIEKSESYDPAEMEVYRSFLETFKGQTFKVSEQQAQYLEEMYGEPFNKIAFRLNSRVKLSKTKGIELDNVYEQLVEDSGYTLDYVTLEEEAYAIVDMVEGLRPQPKLMNGMNTVEQAYDVALDVFNGFFESQAMDKANMEVKRYVAQIKQKQKLIQEKNDFRYKAQLNAIRKENRAQRDRQVDYYEERLKEADRSKRAAINAKKKEAAEKYQRMEESYRRKYNALKEKNSEVIDRLLAKNRITARTIRENQERAKAKEQIKKNASAIVTYFNQNTDKKHVPEVLKTPIANFITAIDFTGTADTKTTSEWEESLRVMKDRLNNRQTAIENGYEDLFDAIHGYTDETNVVLKDMEEFLNAYYGAKITELSTTSLKSLNRILRALRYTITNANKLFVNERTKSASKLGIETIRELESKKDKMSHTEIGDAVLNVADAGMMDARSYFYRMGQSGMSIYSGLREAFNNRVWKLREAQEYMIEAAKGIDMSKWTGDKAKIHTFVINGKELKLTTAQVMSIYELRKRGQAMIHMLNGGLKPTTIGKGRSKIERKKPFRDLTEFDIDNITSVLTDDQKRIADAMQQFMSDQCSDWGNETSMLLYGYKRYNAKNYFPISVDGHSVDTKDDTQFFGLKNKGFTKNTVKNAGNALIVGDIFDVFTKHVSEMASYSTFTAPLMDAMKWYNFRDMDYSEDIAKNNGSVKEEIDRVYGNDYLKFFEKLIKDINSESNYDFSESISKMLTSNMKAASVGANIRVAIQQPTAIIRASAVMNPKYLGEGILSNPKKNIEKANKYSAITQWKSWGYFETFIGKSMKGIITGETSLKENVKEKSMILAQLGDNITWGYIWQACENEIKDKKPELKYDSEEFLSAAAKRFDEVIDQTQVVDTVLHRSHIMRNQNGAVQMATAFMAEPTKSYNLLMNAVRNVYENRKGARRKLARAAVALTMTNFINAMAQSLIDAMRDDDDDKKFGKKYLQFWKENFIENMNLISMIPYAKDLISIAQGYDVSRSDMQGVSYLINGSKQLWKWFTNPVDSSGYTYREKHTFYQSFKKVMQGTSQVAGIPIYNLIRDIGSFYHTFTGNTFGGEAKGRTERYQTMAQAYIDGNTEILEEEMNVLLDFGASEDTINKGLNKQMKTLYNEGNATEEQVMKYLEDVQDMQEDEAFFKTQEWGYETQYGKMYQLIDETIESGTSDRAELVSIIKDYTDHGKENSAIKSSITSRYKEKYLNATTAEKANIKSALLTVYQCLGDDYETAKEKIEAWEE